MTSESSARGSAPEHFPSRTLFGSTIDPMHRPMKNVDYSDFASGKWAYDYNNYTNLNEPRYKTYLQNGSKPELNSLESELSKRKEKLDSTQREINEMKNDALNFNFNSPRLALKTNQAQVQDYNNSRRTRSEKFYDLGIRNPVKEGPDNLHGYLLNGNLMDITNPRNKWFTNKSKPIEFYKSANGTYYQNIDMGDKRIEIIDYPSKNVIHMPGKGYHEYYRTSLENFEVPENLRAKFGTRQTEKLLEDKVKVHDTLSKIQNSGLNKKNDKLLLNQSVNVVEDATPSKPAAHSEKKGQESSANAKNRSSPAYNDLSNYLRHSVQHGYPVKVEKSSKEEVHNEKVSKDYLSDKKNVESPHRRKKDWLGKWTEANVISQRQRAALDEYISNQKAKLGELARVKYEPKPRETKKEEPKVVKPKAEPPAKPQPKVEPVAEPPPPPPKPEKDTEFWNYYDKKTSE